MSNDNPIKVEIPMIMESMMLLKITVLPGETASQLCRRIGVYPPSTLCSWPRRVRVLAGENVYGLIRRGDLLYIHSRDLWDPP